MVACIRTMSLAQKNAWSVTDSIAGLLQNETSWVSKFWRHLFVGGKGNGGSLSLQIDTCSRRAQILLPSTLSWGVARLVLLVLVCCATSAASVSTICACLSLCCSQNCLSSTHWFSWGRKGDLCRILRGASNVEQNMNISLLFIQQGNNRPLTVLCW